MSNASSQAPTPPSERLKLSEQFAESKQKSHWERHEQDWRVEPSQALNEARNECERPDTGNPEHDEQWHQQDEQVTSSPAVNGGASLPQREPGRPVRFSRLALPASMGRVSTLGRERLVALSRALPSESVSSRSIFNRPLSPNRSNLAVLCRHGSHLVGQRPSTGLPARRKHGWSAAHIPRSFAMGCGVTLSKHTFADDLAVSVGVPAVPLAAVASRNGRDSRPP